MSADVIERASAMLADAADLLLEADLTMSSSAESLALLDRLETHRRRLEAVDQRLLAQINERYLAGEQGASDIGALLTQRLRVTPGEAKARVGRARDLGPRRELTGAALPPSYPGVAAAVQAGEISAAGHASVIIRVLDRVPPEIAVEALPVAEKMMVEAARHQHPGLLARTGEMLLARLDPDGREPSEG